MIFQEKKIFIEIFFRFNPIAVDHDPTELLEPIDPPFAQFRPLFWGTPSFSAISLVVAYKEGGADTPKAENFDCERKSKMGSVKSCE